jgi:hypothetical protein
VFQHKRERERERCTLTVSVYLGLPSGKREKKEEAEVLRHPVPT